MTALDQDTLAHCRLSGARALRLGAYTRWSMPWLSLALRPEWLLREWAPGGTTRQRGGQQHVSRAADRMMRRGRAA